MGSLTIPESGLVYVDSQILIYTVERVPSYADVLLPLWRASREGRLKTLTSELSVLEVMTGPLKTGNQRLIDAYDEFLGRTEVSLIQIDLRILRDAAQLRAASSLRTPDAIHAATALATNCSLFLTNDLAFRTVDNIPALILKDLVDS